MFKRIIFFKKCRLFAAPLFLLVLGKAISGDESLYASKEEEILIKKGYIFFPQKIIRPTSIEVQPIKILAPPEIITAQKNTNTPTTPSQAPPFVKTPLNNLQTNESSAPKSNKPIELKLPEDSVLQNNDETIRVKNSNSQYQNKSVAVTLQTESLIEDSISNNSSTSLEFKSNGSDQTQLTDSNKSFYVSIGNRFVLGYTWRKSLDFGVRTEVSGSSKSDANKNVDGSTYDFYQKDTSFGAYVDWYPAQSNFRLTGGININDMRTRLGSINNGYLNVNGSQVALGGSTFNVDLKFPVLTPYVGLGFTSKNSDSLGINFYGDAGLMIGKYNATATTTLIGVQNVTASSIDAELTNIRKSLFKYSFIPTASVGLTYRYN